MLADAVVILGCAGYGHFLAGGVTMVAGMVAGRACQCQFFESWVTDAAGDVSILGRAG